ncbi:hypothetical protein LAJ19_15865 (plasmid) [Deinococcus taeanensis]|uniref:hypothetical protein n=1 Tax=Deinococcus taeanensis TaxID=2737050 RepID=UPI001CDBB732|nr:hypothetical protein [Deinococcus taeanensis]UBV44642.1 hypothetical protein LAJ19_15865 [Deinococcus taeanensis]
MILLISLLTAISFVQPLKIKQEIEKSKGYPKDIIIFSSKQQMIANAPEIPNDLRRIELNKLQYLEDTGLLGYWGAQVTSYRNLPIMKVSKNIYKCGIASLVHGRSPKFAKEVLSINGSWINVGNKVNYSGKDMIVTGKITTDWLPVNIKPSSLIIVDKISKISLNDYPTYFAITRDAAKISLIQNSLESIYGIDFETMNMSDFTSKSVFYTQNARHRVERNGGIFLIAISLIMIFSLVHTSWLRQRNMLEIYRMLGKSKADFRKMWLTACIKYWIYGYVMSIAITLLITSDLITAAGYYVIYIYFVSLFLAALVITSIFVKSGTGIGRQSNSIDLRDKKIYNSIILIVSTVICIGVPYIINFSYRLWTDQQKITEDLGIDTLVILNSNISNKAINTIDCPKAVSCTAFNWSDTSLWPADMDDMIPNDLDRHSSFIPSEASLLGLKLSEGRWPKNNSKEAVISSAGINRLKKLGINIKIGFSLNFGYKIVGIIELPAHSSIKLFSGINFYESYLFIPMQDRGLYNDSSTNQKLYLSPFGNSGIFIRESSADSSPEIIDSVALRTGRKNIEIYTPTSYAKNISDNMKRALLKVSAFLVASIIISCLMFYILSRERFSLMTEEINIYRTLGMSKSKTLVRFYKQDLPWIFTPCFFLTIVFLLIGGLNNIIFIFSVAILALIVIFTYLIVINLSLSTVYQKTINQSNREPQWK